MPETGKKQSSGILVIFRSLLWLLWPLKLPFLLGWKVVCFIFGVKKSSLKLPAPQEARTLESWSGTAGNALVLVDEYLFGTIEGHLRSLEFSYIISNDDTLPESAVLAESANLIVAGDDYWQSRGEEIRKSYQGAKLLLLTTDGSESLGRTAKNSGWDDFLVLPVLRKTFANAVETLLRSAPAKKGTKKSKAFAGKTFIEDAEELEKQYTNSGLSQETFAAAHNKSTSTLNNWLVIGRMDEQVKKFVISNFQFFGQRSKSWFVDSITKLPTAEQLQACHEIVELRKRGEDVTGAQVKDLVAKILEKES